MSCLLFVLTFVGLTGCGGSSASQQQAALAKNDPKAEFEWGMKRLDRALRMSRPSSADGLYTERKMSYEFFPSDGTGKQNTAKVTVTTEAEFIHGKRQTNNPDEAKGEKEEDPKINDPLANKSDEDHKLYDIPGVGPKAPSAPAPVIESRSLDSETVFDLAYVDGKWKLENEPEHKYEKLWFEYAFPE